MNHRSTLLLLSAILVGHLLLALGYSALNPLGEAPDEADHWAYIVYLAKERALPVGPKVTQSKHPPLYHATAALVASLAEPGNDFLRSNPDVDFVPHPAWSPNFFIHGPEETWPGTGGIRAFYLARLWSVVLSTMTVGAGYALARLAFPALPHLALVTAAVLAFVPEFLFISSAVNNDNAAAFFGTAALWGAFAHLRNGGRFRPGWWTPLALGFGLLSKTSTLALWPVVGLAIVLGVAGESVGDSSLRGKVLAIVSHWRRWVHTGLAVFVPALLIASPWLIRNWQLYGDPLGMALTRQTIDLRTTPWHWADTRWLFTGWFRSFWGKFGGVGQVALPAWIYLLLLSLTLLSAIGVIRFAVKANARAVRSAILVLGLAVLATVAGIWQYSLIALGTDQGRLLFPAVAAIVLLWVVGLLTWLPPRHQRKGGLVLGVLFLLLGLYGYVGVIQPAFAPPPPVHAVSAIPPQTPIEWGELSLQSWQLDGDPVLYWRATVAPTQDWRVILRVVAADGTLVWEWRRSPAAGRWRTDRWSPDVIVQDAYQIRWPEWAGPGRYYVEVGLQPFGEEILPPSRIGDAPAQPEQQFVQLGEITR